MGIFKEDPMNLLYTLASVEGEGWGTAYEYWVKIKHLRRTARDKLIRTILVAGLPEKYGYSLECIALASYYQSAVTIVDEREGAIRECLGVLKKLSGIPGVFMPPVTCQKIDGWQALADLSSFDLVVSTGVLQRVPAAQRYSYIQVLFQKAKTVAVFAPNGNNKAHGVFTGLRTVTRGELNEYAGRIQPKPGRYVLKMLDLPPFPPGVYRPAPLKNTARLGMVIVLRLWYYIEVVLPDGIKSRLAHIVSVTFQR